MPANTEPSSQYQDRTKSAQTVRLTVELHRVRPTVRRVVEVPAEASLHLLHWVIQSAFDWDSDHLYFFENRRGRWGDPMLDDVTDDETAPITALASRPGAKFAYVYDMGTWWDHRISVDAIGEGTGPVCLSATGPNLPEYDGSEARPFDLDEVNKHLAELDLAEFIPTAPTEPEDEWPLTEAESARLAAAVRSTPVITALVALAQWAAPGRAATPAGYLKRHEVPGAHEALGLPAPRPDFHSARNLARFDGWWQIALKTGFIDVGTTATTGPAIEALADDREAIELWRDLAEHSIFGWRIEHGLFHHDELDNRGAKLIARTLVDQLRTRTDPLHPKDLGDHRDLSRVLLDQLCDLGIAEHDTEGRYQVSELGAFALAQS